MRNRLPALCLASLVAIGGAVAGGEDFTRSEKAAIASLSLAALPPLPPDASNRYADDPAAAAFGATLFFDQRMSPDGMVSCATCHRIDRQFQDDLPLAKGVATGNRRTMPLAGVAWNSWFFWDGRRDSLWSQALVPLEDPREQAGTRAFYAHFIAGNFAERYERIFGPLPDLAAVPPDAGPLGNDAARAAWKAMSAGQQDGVDRVFANLGKALAAFQRSITPEATRFDRFAEALSLGAAPAEADAFSAEETAGLKIFLGKGRCATCHSGPRLTDDAFHNTGVPVVPGLPEDLGRRTAVRQVEADPFNCFGTFSDARPDRCGALRSLTKDDPRLTRAYKTPSLRGVATRPPYMHSGQFATLDAVVEHYATASAAQSGETELRPVALSERERRQLIAFLKTLSN